ncbi:MAG: hypothetical protein IPK10_19035 [Bacteroidetes bacterium]|nr:hypothetical protein [Bacteroidota bacterium]
MMNDNLFSLPHAKRLQRLLILILLFRIISYFVLADNVTVVQLTKASLRVFLTLFLAAILFFQTKQKGESRFKYLQIAPIVLYGFYLILGAASLFWSSSFSSSALQWLMDLEGFFIRMDVHECFLHI